MINITDEHLIEVAKLIDNNFIGKYKASVSRYNSGVIIITTNECDDCSVVKLYTDKEEIRAIKYCNEDTSGFEDILFITSCRVINKLTELGYKI